MVARRDWTRQWWASVPTTDELVTSPAVVDELNRGEFPGKDKALALLEPLPILEITDAIAEIVEAYIAHQLMPADPFGDALHLALASHHLRLPGYLELQASCQRQQIWENPTHQRYTWSVRTGASHAFGTTWRGRIIMTMRTILEEIRSVRHAISNEIGHDPRRITDYYQRIQADLKDWIINRSGESKTDQIIRCAETVKSDDLAVNK